MPHKGNVLPFSDFTYVKLNLSLGILFSVFTFLAQYFLFINQLGVWGFKYMAVGWSNKSQDSVALWEVQDLCRFGLKVQISLLLLHLF